MTPRTRYARSGDLSIAYQVVGDGPVDLVLGPGFISHVEHSWEDPGHAHYLRRLAAFSRLIVFDKRGTGLSDRAAGVSPLAERMDDVRAVMDATGSARAVVFGVSGSGPLMALFAATYPERAVALILYGAYASAVRAPDYPWRPTAEEYAAQIEARARTIHETWGTLDAVPAPGVAGDAALRRWFAASQRLGASPGAAVALMRMNATIDIRHVLPAIRVPTLVLHRTGDPAVRIEEGRYLAAHIPGARLVELPGDVHFPYAGDVDALVDEVEAFVTGTRPAPVPDRALATVLVSEVAGAAARAVALGDRRWADLQERFRALARRDLDRYRGRALDLAGDRVVATFDGPGRALRCAGALRDAAGDLGLATRAGLHTGECEVRGARLGGVAPALAAWVASQAAPGEILASGTVRDLLAGADLRFVDRGTRALADAPGAWRLYAVLSGAEGDVGPAYPPAPPTATLTRREREVLPLVARGLSNRQIAAALSIGERTVESHVASILAKLGAANRAQLAPWAAAGAGGVTAQPRR
ncbi:MAG TPA: alpha/beta fold hydrolase [Thermomicrobiales bacterium]|nr:alpha/beta fold hydrolase [Thermomicrobiales bacterium]